MMLSFYKIALSRSFVKIEKNTGFILLKQTRERGASIRGRWPCFHQKRAMPITDSGP